MSDPRFEGVTLNVGWWRGFSPTNRPGIVMFDPTSHPTEWVDIAAAMCRSWRQIWCNQMIVADRFPFDRVRVWSRSGRSKMLSDHPEAAKWVGVLKAGEFWTYVGESWIDAEDKK